MTSSIPKPADEGRPAQDHATRQPYETPGLVDRGDVKEQTKSTGGGPGPDAPYS